MDGFHQESQKSQQNEQPIYYRVNDDNIGPELLMEVSRVNIDIKCHRKCIK